MDSKSFIYWMCNKIARTSPFFFLYIIFKTLFILFTCKNKDVKELIRTLVDQTYCYIYHYFSLTDRGKFKFVA